ncbi:MAG: alpha/beta hydrolase [Geminicoccaceae bacterium]
MTDAADWDDAYANMPHIEGGESYPPRWQSEAVAFREQSGDQHRAQLDLAYGEGERQRLDLFHPEGHAQGLVVFVHGGFWRAFDKSYWSHLAAGALAKGWAVALPSYTLCPQATIPQIGREIATAIRFAAERVEGPVYLIGHSAGGHLVTRLLCEEGSLLGDLAPRIGRVISISGLHDLRPLLKTKLNDDLRLDMATARAESPALLTPLPGLDLVCWVGANERPEFLRQNALLATIWSGFDLSIKSIEEPGRHHFDVIDGLTRADGALTTLLLER